MIGIWAVATAATGAVALALVRAGGDAVGDQAFRPVSAAELEAFEAALPITAATTTAPAGSGTAEPAIPTADPVPTTSPPPTTVAMTIATQPDPAVPTTIASPAATTPSPASPEPDAPPIASGQTTTEAFTLAAGTVVVSWDDGGVTLVSASPAPGYRVEVKSAGPAQVKVEFEAEGAEQTFQAEVSDGQLQVRTGGDSDD